MPISFVVDVERGRILVELSGQISGPDLLRAKAEIAAHPDFSPAFDLIMDNRQITHLVDVPSQVVWELAKRPPGSAKSRAVIITKQGSPFYYGMARMFQIDREISESSSQITICDTLAEAEAFLKGAEPERE